MDNQDNDGHLGELISDRISHRSITGKTVRQVNKQMVKRQERNNQHGHIRSGSNRP